LSVRELPLVGLIALAFGLGSYYATGEFGTFGMANVGLGALALLGAAVASARRFRGFGAPDARRVLGPPLVVLGLALAVAVALERIAAWAELQFDWTVEQHFELSDATRESLQALSEDLHATLFREQFDPRVRRTRLLLETFAQAGRVQRAEKLLTESSQETERFGISSSNTVVLELGNRFETVERPSEGALYEALQRLLVSADLYLYLARGEGEGDFSRTDESGFSGFAAALQTEGYRLRDLILASVSEIPADAAAVILLSPERSLRPEAIEALRRYLEGGGRLIAFLDPGHQSGLEGLLAEFGFDLPDRMVVDPASGPVEGDPPGVNPVVYVYSEHPVVRPLDRNRMTFLLRARPVFPKRKPEADDELRALAFTSSHAWLGAEGTVAPGAAPGRPPGGTGEHYPLAALGRYPRGDHEARIVVFGDGDFVSNRYLRALYNLDLVMNAVHWATERTESITLRPKGLAPNQFPLTPQETLRMLYGVGLLLPELLLIAGGIVWLRRRSA
jgi:hypothetical protein